MIWVSLILLSRIGLAADVSFEKIEIKVKNVAAHVQLADNDERREHGLMFVKILAPNEGMLFVFENERTLSFWMKNTLIPLSIGFFDHDGRLVDTQEMKPSPSLMDQRPPSYQSAAPATYALEMPASWFKKNHLENGAQLTVLRGAKSALLRQKVQTSARQTSSGHSH